MKNKHIVIIDSEYDYPNVQVACVVSTDGSNWEDTQALFEAALLTHYDEEAFVRVPKIVDIHNNISNTLVPYTEEIVMLTEDGDKVERVITATLTQFVIA